MIYHEAGTNKESSLGMSVRKKRFSKTCVGGGGHKNVRYHMRKKFNLNRELNKTTILQSMFEEGSDDNSMISDWRPIDELCNGVNWNENTKYNGKDRSLVREGQYVDIVGLKSYAHISDENIVALCNKNSQKEDLFKWISVPGKVWNVTYNQTLQNGNKKKSLRGNSLL